MKKDSLNQNAAQAKCLFENIPFILWSYRGNEKLKKAWVCVESLLKICQIIYSSEITEEDLTNLENEVHIHLSSFQHIFEQTLKPKQHNMLHYAEIIRKMGPLVNMNMMRYEAKHKQIKNYVGMTENYKDFPKYLATMHQRKLLSKKNTYKETYSHGILTPIRNLSEQQKDVLSTYFTEINDIEHVKWMQYYSTRFSERFKILHNHNIYEILRIVHMHNKFYFLCVRYIVDQFHSFSNSLKIEISDPVQYKIISFEELSLKKTFESKMIERNQYIKANTLELKQVHN